MDYMSKYIKYKSKYLKLKDQLGGSDIDRLIESMGLDNLHMIPANVTQYLASVIPSDKFIDPVQVKSLIETIGLDKLIEQVALYYLYQKVDLYHNVLNIYANPNNFFSKLSHVVLATRNIWVHLKKFIETNTHTVLLIPGDSPTYFLFLLKLLYPEILSNPKVTICEFPISGLGSMSDNVIEFMYDADGVQTDYKINVDGKPYMKFIIESNVPESVRQNPHQFVIIDYLEAGKSAVFIEHTIKELYELEPYRLEENFVQVINLAYYFQTKSEIKIYLSEFKDLKNKIKEQLKTNPNCFSGLDGVKRFEKFLFANWYLYLDPKFLKELNNFATDKSLNVLKYLVDESDRRCQYKIRLSEAICVSSRSSSMAEFLSQIPKPDSIHLHCNIFYILLYLISEHLSQLNKKTGELFEKITGKISSLIPKGIPIRLIIRDLDKALSLTINPDDLINNQIKIGQKNTIGLLDVKTVSIN